MPRTKMVATSEAQDNELSVEDAAHSCLLSYVRLQWDGYEISKHHQLIANHLEAVERGDISRLMIFLPPRHGKTLLASEYFPAWYLGRNPSRHIIATTYSFDRANDIGRKVRNQLTSAFHQQVFSGCRISKDSKGANKFSTEQDGMYYSVGVGGAITGRGANCLTSLTKIETDRGFLEIKKLVELMRSGEKIEVLSWNENLKTQEFRKIVATMVSSKDDIYEVSTKSGKKIKSTGDHPFFVVGTGYVAAKSLESGMKLVTVESYDFVSGVRKIRCGEVPVYDIQVEGTNNFFANEILVHNCLIIDDPTKGREDAESDVAQRKLRDWFKAVAYTRLMDNNSIIVIMTRWSFYDLAGFLLEEAEHENWTVLDLPAIADGDGDVIGREIGDALWPTKYGRKRLDRIRKTIGTREWNALYQQQPLPEGGGIVDIEWFKKYPYQSWQYAIMPDMTSPKNKFAGEKYRRFLKPSVDNGKITKVNQIVNSWDTAFKEQDINDPSACTTWGIAEDRYYLMNVINKRLIFPKLKRAVIAEYERCMKFNAGQVVVLIEDKASGQSLIQELQRYTRIPVIAIKPDANKQVRLSEVSPIIEAGKVYVPERGDWVVPYETQIAQFPFGKFDDMVDSTSQFLRWVTRPKYVRRKSTKFWK